MINQVKNIKPINFFLIIFFVILSLPLWDLPPYFFPGDWCRAIVSRSLLSILLFIILLKNEIGFQKIKEIFHFKSKIFLPSTALLIYFSIVFLSVLFSLDIQNSLWDSPERGDGFINFSFFVIFCFLGLLIIKKENDWKKLLNFSLIIGFLIGLFAIFQLFGVLNAIFQKISIRPIGTLGNPIILGLYLLLLSFVSLSFFVLESNKIKKCLYLFFFIFSLIIIAFVAQTRAALLGIGIGFMWFIFFYPQRGSVKIKSIKLGVFILLGLSVILLLFFKYNPQIYKNWNPVLENAISRIISLTKGLEAEPTRIFAWQIAFNAFKERPLLGYGPWNFSIAYYKYYKPFSYNEALKNFKFDRAHSSLVEILIGSGIFALFFYLLFFFSLFWQLQKIKKEYFISHGLQSSFLAYFVASLASIESFSLFLLFFLFVSYSFSLINLSSQKKAESRKEIKKTLNPFFIFLFFCLLLLFLWQYNFVPFKQNIEINKAKLLASESRFEESFKILGKESKKKTILLPYLNSTFIKLLVDRNFEEPEKEIENAEKIAEIAEKNSKIKPYNMENWQKLGESLLTIAENKKDYQLGEKAKEAFQTALKLAPQREIVIFDAFLADIFLRDFEKAKEKTDFCQKNFPEIAECLWMTGLLKIYQNDVKEGKIFIERAIEKGFFSNYSTKEIPLNQLINAFVENKNYKELVPIYEELIKIKPLNPQYKASLAFVYRELKEYKKSREIALKILETNPEMEREVKRFLDSLPY